MISLLYHSHTVVPNHLTELEALGLIEPDEEILVALDGVLLDGSGHRLSGPTLHDYCLVTNLRVILWARDYGRHLCYAFPLAELTTVEGTGIDPIHAQIQLCFAAPDEDDQNFSLALLPLANLQAALTLLRTASEAARDLADQGVDSREAGAEIMAILGEQIYGHVDGLRPGETPYRWPGAGASQQVSPGPAFVHDPANLPPGQFYTAGRLARSAWDTLRRSIREADLPIEINSGSLRELTEAVRAINELVVTVASNPSAQQMAMAFINNRNNNNQGAAPAPTDASQRGGASQRTAAPAQAPAEASAAGGTPAPAVYHEIPLRRRPTTPQPQVFREPTAEKPVETAQRSSAERRADPPVPDRREIPLRRGQAAVAPMPVTHGHLPAVSGSGDAGPDDRSPMLDDRHQ